MARDLRESIDLDLIDQDEHCDGSDSEAEGETNLDTEEISPSLTPKPKTSVTALITKHIAKVTFVVLGVVAILGFIRAIRYPRTRSEWEFTNPILRLCEGVPVAYMRVTSPIPCTPEDPTARWIAYNNYKAISLGGQPRNDGWGSPPRLFRSRPELRMLGDYPGPWLQPPSELARPP